MIKAVELLDEYNFFIEVVIIDGEDCYTNEKENIIDFIDSY